MKIHEYQAKEILHSYGVPIPESKLVSSVKEVEKIALEIGLPVVIKAQIHAGGRGKGGGVRFANTKEQLVSCVKNMLGMKLLTPQTGTEGKTVNKLLVESALPIERELYAGIVLDRSSSSLHFMVSTEGGMEIEKVAKENPEKIVKIKIDPSIGLLPFQAREMAFALNLPPNALKNADFFFMSLYKAYVNTDASLLEINPIALTIEGKIFALDAKANFDDNALFRQKTILKLRDEGEEEPTEFEASKLGLNYIKLEGNIGCMVNGAGLAMATMDVIKLAGGTPANFLDIGGGASATAVEKGLEMILSDENVKAILVNIFGGIVRCDRVANGVIQAMKNIKPQMPVVVRLQGTNAEEAKQMLKKSKTKLLVASELKEAAEKLIATL